MSDEIKYCQKCGAENNADAIYCLKCGYTFNETPTLEADKKISGFATAGFIMSFLTLFLDYNTTIYDIDFFLGIIFCFIGLHYTKDGKQKGRGLAIAGIILYIIVFIFMLKSAQ